MTRLINSDCKLVDQQDTVIEAFKQQQKHCFNY